MERTTNDDVLRRDSRRAFLKLVRCGVSAVFGEQEEPHSSLEQWCCLLWTRGRFDSCLIACRMRDRILQRVWSNTTGNDRSCRCKTTAKKQKQKKKKHWCVCLLARKLLCVNFSPRRIFSFCPSNPAIASVCMSCECVAVLPLWHYFGGGASAYPLLFFSFSMPQFLHVL